MARLHGTTHARRNRARRVNRRGRTQNVAAARRYIGRCTVCDRMVRADDRNRSAGPLRHVDCDGAAARDAI